MPRRRDLDMDAMIAGIGAPKPKSAATPRARGRHSPELVLALSAPPRVAPTSTPTPTPPAGAGPVVVEPARTRTVRDRQPRPPRQPKPRRAPRPPYARPPASAPLINAYKLAFVRRRLLQTFLGGVRRQEGQPAYATVAQQALWLLPVAIAVLFSLLMDAGLLARLAGALACGAVVAVAAGALRLYARWVRLARGLGAAQSTVDDEDTVVFDGLTGPGTVGFLIAPRPVGPALCYALAAGAVAGGAALYLLPGNLERQYGHPGWALLPLGWFAVGVALHGLVAVPPPEPNAFFQRRLLGGLDLAALGRPVHVAAFFAALAGVAIGNQLHTYLYVAFALLPAMWLLALLPPLDALYGWAVEQSLVHGLGGSPAPTDFCTTVMAVLSTVPVVVAYALLDQGRDVSGALAVAALAGAVLSQDVWRLVAVLRRGLSSRARVGPAEEGGPAQAQRQASPPYTWLEALTAALLPAAAVAVAVLVESNHNPTTDLLGYTLALWVLWLLLLTLRHLQRVFVLGVARNPLHPRSTTSLQPFARAKARLARLGLAHRVLMHLVPLVTVGWLSLSLRLDDRRLFLNAVALVRAYRWAWQRPLDALLEAAITGALIESLGFGGMSSALLFLVVSFLHQRWKELLRKLQFMATVYYTFWTLPKMRVAHARLLTAGSLLLAPFALLISVALSSPLLPLFGLPLFFVGFPRPLRSWPGPASASASKDTIYYEHAWPVVSHLLASKVADGSLGGADPGAQLLLRFENRMLWVSVLEAGFNFRSVVFKGLELQETSCHTVEASRVEDVFDAALECTPASPTLNQNLWSALHPLGADFVGTFSDTRSALTGLIDAPDTLAAIDRNFIHCLVFHLQARLQHDDCPPAWRHSPLAGKPARLKNLMSHFPAGWYRFLSEQAGKATQTPTTGTWVASENGNGNGNVTTRDGGDPTLLSARDPVPTLALFCYDALVGGPALNPGAQRVVRLFNGEIPAGEGREWMDAGLTGLALGAYRQAVKLALDQAIMLDYGLTDHEELLADLVDFRDKWHVGPEAEPAWAAAIRSGTPSLFSLSRDAEAGTFHSHLLVMRDICVRIGLLNEAGVRALWAALHLELLYMANDDDERYSIQAHPVLLRNLTVQASDPPLGYPVFASSPVSLPLRLVPEAP